MCCKKFVLLMAILAFLFSLLAARETQERPDVLVPENANEARLNRLQPPDQVMEAIAMPDLH